MGLSIYNMDLTIINSVCLLHVCVCACAHAYVCWCIQLIKINKIIYSSE